MNTNESSRILDAIAADFIPADVNLLPQIAARFERKTLMQTLSARPALTILLVLLALSLLTGVAYAVGRSLGYIPGVGIVDQSSPIRMLAEPVSVTRDGVTVSVNQAVLTGAETRLKYGVSGVPLSAYPEQEAVSGCIEQAYLRLPDGSKIAVNEISAPIPANVDEAVFVLPCIFNTLPGTVPTDWELPLHFIPAPQDLIILPVIDVTPQVLPTASEPGLSSETPTAIASVSPQAVVSVDKIIETQDGYILLGAVRPNIPEGSWLQVTGAAFIRDADGKRVSYSFPTDVQPLDDSSLVQGGFAWVMQIKTAGVKFPLTISFPGVVVSQVDPQASAKITMDVGANPQPEQVWQVNQDVQLAGNTIRLVSVTALSDGYSFRVDPGANLSGVSVEIEGYQSMGGGGGGIADGMLNMSLAYSELPKGQLTLLFTDPLAASPTQTWQTVWQPETLRELPAPVGASGTCLDADTFQTLKPLPAGLDGKVLLTQLNPQLQIVLAGIDGSRQEVIAAGAARASLTRDGARLAYSTDGGMMIVDLASRASSLIAGSFGRDLHWSPDGSRIAYVSSGDVYGIFVTGSDGKNPKQLSRLGYESVAGWSPDGSKLYYAMPGSSGNGFLLRSVDVSSGNTQDMFVLENSSRKAPLPAVSPDGKWIAYRASDNSSLYIKGIDGSQARLVLDNPATAINGIVWESESHLLGVSLITPEYPDGEIILITPNSCETYRLPGLSGQLNGLLMP